MTHEMLGNEFGQIPPSAMWLVSLLTGHHIRALNAYQEEFGAFVGPAEDQRGFITQPHAEDIVLNGRKPQELQNMLELLESFMN
jgi:hypothetical protein